MIKLDKGGRPKKNTFSHTVTGKNQILIADGKMYRQNKKKEWVAIPKT
mgnify:CR=1 FL=1